ncbi:hypothetical protein GCM10007071_11100 [Marinobacter zhanjiangensis]|uniref:Uncharacterized protein n=1 Tax=Marinobacter zhanjiangensis TaxID=578215 RepID=A0ABQ3AW68_9GAMM|nr:hypothetical protein GCM10007071_11100 [Marinobacter zhanjiangensis]
MIEVTSPLLAYQIDNNRASPVSGLLRTRSLNFGGLVTVKQSDADRKITPIELWRCPAMLSGFFFGGACPGYLFVI